MVNNQGLNTVNRYKQITMDTIKAIADDSTELFMVRHFSKVQPDDKMVIALRKSVNETIQKALKTYRAKNLKTDK